MYEIYDQCALLFAEREAALDKLEALGSDAGAAGDELDDAIMHLATAISFAKPRTQAGADACTAIAVYFEDLSEGQGDEEDRVYMRGLYARAAARCKAAAAAYAAAAPTDEANSLPAFATLT